MGLGRCERFNIVIIPPLYQYSVVLTLDCRESPDKTPGSVWHERRVGRVKVFFGCLASKFYVEESFHTQIDLSPTSLVQVAIVANHRVSLQSLRVLVDEVGKVRASNLLFAFEDELEVQGRLPSCFQIAFRGLDAGDYVVLTVRGSPSNYLSTMKLCLKRARDPFVQWFRGLDIIVSID